MIIPTQSVEETVAITVLFWKPIQNWTEDDREQILERLREFMLKQARTKRRRKGTK